MQKLQNISSASTKQSVAMVSGLADSDVTCFNKYNVNNYPTIFAHRQTWYKQ